MSSSSTRLVPATPASGVLLGNLLELYIHDLSAAFPHVQLGQDGRFGYPSLPLYWSEPERRFPFLIEHGGQTAGFALVTRGLAPQAQADVHDVAEFFVLRRHRRAGVGRHAASLLWRELPGRWMVRVAEANPAALAFWSGVVAELPRVERSARVERSKPWQVFQFEVAPG